MSAVNEQTVTGAVAVTPSDTLPNGFTGLYVGGAGDVTVIMARGTDPVTFAAMPAGSFMPIQVSKVMATDTTATLILGLSV